MRKSCFNGKKQDAVSGLTNQDKVEAFFDNGILKLTLPKRIEAGGNAESTCTYAR
jgi:hypothetical protein